MQYVTYTPAMELTYFKAKDVSEQATRLANIYSDLIRIMIKTKDITEAQRTYLNGRIDDLEVRDQEEVTALARYRHTQELFESKLFLAYLECGREEKLGTHGQFTSHTFYQVCLKRDELPQKPIPFFEFKNGNIISREDFKDLSSLMVDALNQG